MGEWKYSSIIFDLGTRWRWVVNFTPQSLYPGEIVPGTHWISARGSEVGWGTMLQAERSPVRVPDEVDCFQFT
jgi:hypothetical protein